MKKSRDSRYLKKILTNVEIEFVNNAENRDRVLWSLWACKETAYKVTSKSSPGAPFLPHRWLVQLNQTDSMFEKGEVILLAENNVFVQIYCQEGYVHCIGSDNLPDLNKIIWGVESLPESISGEHVDPSLFVRYRLSSKLADIYHLDFRQMEIIRAGKGHELQPPYLYYENKKAPFDISLSHDGSFIAYSFISI